jgi:malonyl-CoA/methylmalonyl-CoA synthetase
VSSWQWSPSDTILHALPLHHVHGVINALYCAHAVGATVDFMPKFSPAAMWQQLLVRSFVFHAALSCQGHRHSCF